MNDDPAFRSSNPSGDLPADLRYHAKHVTQGGGTMERAADLIERLTRENAELREGGSRLLTARTRVEERLRAALAGLKDLTCGECVPCNRINAEIDKALSGEPASGHETEDRRTVFEKARDAALDVVRQTTGQQRFYAERALSLLVEAMRGTPCTDSAVKASGEPAL